jgi:transcriptional antiterminator RfaH
MTNIMRVAMPILPAEIDVYPPTLFGEAADERVAGRTWHVLHTKPRQEKSLARQLLEGQVPFYLPLISNRTLIRGRVFTSHIPLFTSYCFVLADEKERLRALATRRVVRTLDVADQKKLWEDLRQIHTLIALGAPIMSERQLVPGTPVEISVGPLAGMRGLIIRRANQRRFLVQVNFIQQGASVELDDFMLVKA